MRAPRHCTFCEVPPWVPQSKKHWSYLKSGERFCRLCFMAVKKDPARLVHRMSRCGKHGCQGWRRPILQARSYLPATAAHTHAHTPLATVPPPPLHVRVCPSRLRL